jgi:hypothetical protein
MLLSGCARVAPGGTLDAGGCDSGVPSVRCLAQVGPTYTNLSDTWSAPLAVDDENVYWGAYGEATNEGVVLRVSRSGGSVVTMAHLAAVTLASDGANLYAATWNSTGSSIVGIPVSGGAAITFASATNANCIAVDDESVYWTSLHEVVKVAKAGGTPVTLASVDYIIAPSPNAIALDATDVYWSTNDIVARVSKAGGPAVTLLSTMFEQQAFDPVYCHLLALSNASLLVADALVGPDGGAEIWSADAEARTWSRDAEAQIWSMPIAGPVPPPPTALVTGGNPFLVAAGSNDVFWMGSRPLTVNETPNHGGATTTLAVPLANGVSDFALASDGTLYWLTNDQVQSIKP